MAPDRSEIYRYFDSAGLRWTSIDPAVRFFEVGNEAWPVFIWVGVMPGTLALGDAKPAAEYCKNILAKYKISDVLYSIHRTEAPQS